MVYTVRTDANRPLEQFSELLSTPYGQMRFPAGCQFTTAEVRAKGVWAPEECMLVQSLLREGQVMLDVGAHCGFLSLAGAHAVGESGLVISVEPTPQTAALLRDNLERLAPTSTQIVEAAAWAESGRGSLSISAANSGDNRSYEMQGPERVGRVEVERVRLDERLALERLDLVKIDTQGAEPYAIAGMRGLLEEFRPAIIFEYWPQGIRDAGSDPAQLLGYLRSLGYQLRVPGALGFGDAPDQLINEIAAITEGEHISLLAVPRSDQADLKDCEAKVHSQNGEDGVIAELVRRVGAPGRYFVEFGAEAGDEGNCALLAAQGWSGLLMEGSPDSFAKLQALYQDNPQVTTRQAMISADNIEELLGQAGAPQEIDVFSIDIDSNDYYVWQSIQNYSPRILIIEYNGQLGDSRKLVMPRNDSHQWDGTDYYGASAAALRQLGEEKGYRLVYTDSCGVNAFFVREDLAGHAAWDEEAVIHPANHFNTGKGHPRDPQDRPWLDLDSGQEVRLGISPL